MCALTLALIIPVTLKPGHWSERSSSNSEVCARDAQKTKQMELRKRRKRRVHCILDEPAHHRDTARAVIGPGSGVVYQGQIKRRLDPIGLSVDDRLTFRRCGAVTNPLPSVAYDSGAEVILLAPDGRDFRCRPSKTR
jgi:hypothetical protein